MNITFENAKEEDLFLLFLLNKDLIHRYEDLSSIDYPGVLDWVQNNIRATLPHFRRVLADGRLAAFYCFAPSEDGWELDSLFVLPEYQNRGIGTGILRHCIRESSGSVFLYVFRKNTRAVALYERMGFRITKALNTRYIMTYRGNDPPQSK